VFVEFVQALLISGEPDVLLRDAVSEINPDDRMNACFLCRSDKGKYRCTAVDVLRNMESARSFPKTVLGMKWGM